MAGPAFFYIFDMTLSTEIETIIAPVLDRMEIDLVQGTFVREHGGKVLRLFIERKGATPESGSGVDLGLCAAVSREVGAALEVDDVIDSTYSLEVSSPGIERPLVRPQDYVRFSGKTATVTTKGPVDGRRKFRGTIRGYEDDAVLLEMEDGSRAAIPNELIKKANLVFDAKV